MYLNLISIIPINLLVGPHVVRSLHRSKNECIRMDYFHAHISRKLGYPSLLFFGRFKGSDLTDCLMYQGREGRCRP